MGGSQKGIGICPKKILPKAKNLQNLVFTVDKLLNEIVNCYVAAYFKQKNKVDFYPNRITVKTIYLLNNLFSYGVLFYV